MSLNTAGLNQKSKTTSIVMKVLSTDPLIELSNKLSWESLYNIIVLDLKATAKGYWYLGRSLYVRIHLGAFILQSLFKWTDRQTEELISSTPKYQVFCGCGLIQNWKVSDHTRIEEFRNRLSPSTHKLVGDYFLKYAVESGFGDASWMDIDSTVQEANMAYPADCNLLKKLALKTKKVSNWSAPMKLLRHSIFLLTMFFHSFLDFILHSTK